MSEIIEVRNSVNFTIAVGQSCREIVWINLPYNWTTFLNQIKSTKRTKETQVAYFQMSKENQRKVKDVGGFVGGVLKDGKRNKQSVLSRQLITLDMDNLKGCDWRNALNTLRYAWAVYSTHKHTPEEPRLRLVIPLDEAVGVEAYEAIARKIAFDLGMEMFDPTTFEPCRLMFWSSTSKDGEYIFLHNDSEILKPQTILDEYQDWKNVNEWAHHENEAKAVQKERTDKQQDPLLKDGPIGTFCRAYTIQEAIEEYLSDVYVVGDIEDRYTYAEGTTANGVIIYDNKFLFSHHSTDPVQGRLLNAFDLVRLHKFGDGDKSVDAMIKLIGTDKNVLATQIVESFEILKDQSWRNELEITSKGQIAPSIENFLIIFRNDENLEKAFTYNEFQDCHEIDAGAAFCVKPGKRWDKRPFTDTDISSVVAYFEHNYGMTHEKNFMHALMITFEKNKYHPIKEYLDGLKWDGKRRLEFVFSDYLGVENSLYAREVTRKQFVACVKRIYEPGCKKDEILVLQGEQGIGKSTLLEKLGGAWYSSSLDTMGGKESYEQLQGAWIIELAELVALKRTDIERYKNFVSKTEDRYRPAYGRMTKYKKRQCVFFGSTNEAEFLNDPTGNRRWWILACRGKKAIKSVWKDLDQHEIDQIWAEAKHLYENKESLLLSKEAAEEAKENQRNYEVQNGKEGIIEEFLSIPIPQNFYEMGISERKRFFAAGAQGNDLVQRDVVSAIEIWYECLGDEYTTYTNAQAREIKSILRRSGEWEEGSYTRLKGYGRQRIFNRK